MIWPSVIFNSGFGVNPLISKDTMGDYELVFYGLALNSFFIWVTVSLKGVSLSEKYLESSDNPPGLGVSQSSNFSHGYIKRLLFCTVSVSD